MSIPSSSERIDGLADLWDGGGTQSSQSLAAQDAEPYLDLVEPRGMGGRVMEIDARVAGKPPVMFGLVGAKVVEDDMQVLIRVTRDHPVHEVQELAAPPAAVVTHMGKPRRHLQGSEEGGRAMPLVFMVEPSQGFPIGQPQPALGAFQGLDSGLLIQRLRQ